MPHVQKFPVDSSLVASVGSALSQTIELASKMEAGSAVTPFQDLLRSSREGLLEGGTHVVILSLDTMSFARMFTHFLGLSSAVVADLQHLSPRQFEISFTQQSVFWEDSHGGRRFASLERLLCERIAPDSTYRPATWLPKRTSLSIVTEFFSYEKLPAFYGLLRQCDVLVIAGSEPETLDELALETIQDAARNALITWLIECRSVGPVKSVSWPVPLQNSAVQCDCVTGEEDLPRPEWFLDDTLPKFLSCMRTMNTTIVVLDSMTEEMSRGRLQIELRKKQHSVSNRPPGSPERSALESAKRKNDQAFSNLDTTIEEIVRERQAPTGRAMNRLNNAIEDIGKSSLHIERRGNLNQLSLNAESVRMVKGTLSEMVREAINSDTSSIQERMDSICGDVGDQLHLPGGTLTFPATMPLDGSTLFSQIEPSIHLEYRYEGEIPRRGFMERIMRGRRPVYLVMMMTSLVGGALGIKSELRAWLPPIMLGLFVIGLVSTSRSLKKEEEERVRKELGKAREGLLREVRRLFEQGIREWQQRITKRIREAQRSVSGEIDELLREKAAEQSGRIEKQRHASTERQRRVDGELRDSDGLKQQLIRIRTNAQDTSNKLQQAFAAHTREVKKTQAIK